MFQASKKAGGSFVTIIGAGIAGISCAIQLKLCGIEPFLIEKKSIGGLVVNANLVKNYPGFGNGISGVELAEKFRLHLQSAGIVPVIETVEKVSYTGGNFIIKTAKSIYTSQILVVASGTKPKTNLLFPDSIYEISDLQKEKCHGKTFAIIGAGDAAFDYSINLVNNYGIEKTLILNRNNNAKCIPLLENRASETKKIQHLKNVSVKKIHKNGDKFTLKAEIDSKTIEFTADFVFSAIGREPQKDFLDESLFAVFEELEQAGKLYSIGDVKNGSFRQVSIASSDGIKAAMKIFSKAFY